MRGRDLSRHPETMRGRYRAALKAHLMPNTAQDSMPNNSQSDSEIEAGALENARFTAGEGDLRECDEPAFQIVPTIASEFRNVLTRSQNPRFVSLLTSETPENCFT
jgi:hypothetical protein